MLNQTMTQVVDHFSKANMTLAKQIDELHTELGSKDATILLLKQKVTELEHRIQKTSDTGKCRFEQTQ